MNELIAIHNDVSGLRVTQTVNAKELHAFLEVGTRFDKWIARRIEEYGFMQDVDFVRSFLAVESGGSGVSEIHISLDMAKELSMVERNEKGKQARQYFLECERRALAANPAALPNFSDPVAAARAWADATEREQQAAAALALAAPKVEFVDRYVEAETGSMGFRQVAKLLGVKENAFRQFLLENRIMYRLGGVLTAYAEHIDADRFEVKTGVANEHAYQTSKFTAKGVQWIAEKYRKAI